MARNGVGWDRDCRAGPFGACSIGAAGCWPRRTMASSATRWTESPPLLPGGPSLSAPSSSARSAASAGCGLRTTPGKEAGIGEGNRRQLRDQSGRTVDVNVLPRAQLELQALTARKRNSDDDMGHVQQAEEHI